ncbi:hypothetical protein BKA61DRAFT_500591, partial [Leptodontidium sp. MPI-SDFR-AT-0119]
VRYIRRKNQKCDSILKAVSYKASTNIRIIAITDKKTKLAICFRTSVTNE